MEVPDSRRRQPLVTVVIPCRNEERSIDDAIRSIGRQTVPTASIEVVVVDGGSSDGTEAVAKRALATFGFARGEVVSNPVGTTPSNLNAGLAWAEGEIIVRVDARSRVPADYVERVVQRLADDSIAVVGGSQVALAPSPDLRGRAIARALNNRFGMGLSRYRRHGAPSGVVDTVYLGVFRRNQLQRTGGWSETFTTNQDFELNRRMQAFGSVWFEAGLPVGYVPRGTLRELWRQYHRFGRAKVRYWQETGDRPRPRQMVLIGAPPIAASAVVAIARRGTIVGRLSVAVVGMLGLFVIDRAGSATRAVSPAETVLASAASCIIGAGWWSGVMRGLLHQPGQAGTTR